MSTENELLTDPVQERAIDLTVHRASRDDAEWILHVMQDDALWLVANPRLVWLRFWQGHAPNEHWDVIRPLGFVHWRRKVSGGRRVVYEIAVDPLVRGQGVGRALMRHVGRPVELKTRADNERAIGFYQRLGLARSQPFPSRDGKLMYVKFVGL